MNGMNFAIAFTAYDNERESILDPSYGRLIFNHYSWGPDQNGTYKSIRKEIPSHTCSTEELGLEGQNSSFMPINEKTYDELNLFHKKYICIENEDMYIHGNYNTNYARLLNM